MDPGHPGMVERARGEDGAGLFLLTGHGIPDIFFRFPAGPGPGIIGNCVSIKIYSVFRKRYQEEYRAMGKLFEKFPDPLARLIVVFLALLVVGVIVVVVLIPKPMKDVEMQWADAVKREQARPDPRDCGTATCQARGH